MCKKVICLSDLTKWTNFDFHTKFGKISSTWLYSKPYYNGYPLPAERVMLA